MHVTPVLIAVRLICSVSLPQGRVEGTVADSMRRGHDLFVRLTGCDFGYDLAAWHNHLKESREGGYTYGRNIVLPKMPASRIRVGGVASCC